ncbi:hypothetical protein QS257_06350 [Terrilactibacillus sp. S3-3]|nr:hypothetical protein QS257_06350 [Terrilactibacillus sp. S3-3]
MERLTRILSKRLGFILTLAFLVCLWGLYSAWQIKKDYLPDINNPIVMVTVKMDANANHDEQAAALNKDITGALKETDGLQSVESTLYPQGLFLSDFSAKCRYR